MFLTKKITTKKRKKKIFFHFILVGMHRNSLETRFQEGGKFPIPLKNESYFHRYQPMKFHVEIEGTPAKQYSATGKILLTDQRLTFIARKTSSIDDFETFHIMLGDVVSSIVTTQKHKEKTFSVRIALKSGIVFTMSLDYKRKDLKHKRIFEDYYGMLLLRVPKSSNRECESNVDGKKTLSPSIP